MLYGKRPPKQLKLLSLSKNLNVRNLRYLRENVRIGQSMVGIGSWTYNIVQDKLFLTEEIYSIFECPVGSLDASLSKFNQYIHPDYLELVLDAVKKAHLGNDYDITYQIVTPKDKVKWVNEKVKVLFKDDLPIKIIGTIQDITLTKIRELELKELGETLLEAQEIAGVGSWHYDTINNKIFWSKEIYKIHGISHDDFENNFESLLELTHPDDVEKVKTAVSECLTGKPYRVEYRIPQKDGTVKYVIVIGRPLFDDKKKIIGMHGTVQDITESKLLQIQLTNERENLAKAQSLAKIGSWEMDAQNLTVLWSDENYKIFGMKPGDFKETYREFLKHVHPDDHYKIETILEYPPTEPFTLAFRIIRKDGVVRDVLQHVECALDPTGKLLRINGTIQDITGQKELEKALAKHQETIFLMQKQFQALIDNSTDVFVILDKKLRIQYISPQAKKFIPINLRNLTGRSALALLNRDERIKLVKMIDKILAKPDSRAQTLFTPKADPDRQYHFSVDATNLTEDPAISGFLLQLHDRTQIVEAEKKLAHMATHDDLTDLPNHRLFTKELTQKTQINLVDTPIAVMFLEIDGLRNVNSELGFGYGDKLILEVANRLKSCIEDIALISRYSGSQFALLFRGEYQIADYKNIAQGILDLFSEPFKVDIYEFYISASLGISVFPQDDKEAENLIKYANVALIRARNSGKNQFRFYSPDITASSYKHFVLKNQIFKAIERSQLRVHYQPLVNLQSHEILAAEALIRWEHPHWGLIPPMDFIPLAEESGFIIEIGNWILRKVCNDYKMWIKSGLSPIKVSVNYSSIQFLERNFAKNIKQTTDDVGVRPEFLIVELTESIVMQNPEKAIIDIKFLQRHGIKVALDDFGTGYSSLAYLSTYNMDYLKIDKSFTHKISQDKTAEVITKNIINLARDLKIKLVAEGIETSEQLDFLKKHLCHTGQGFLFSKPVPGEQFMEILASKKVSPNSKTP